MLIPIVEIDCSNFLSEAVAKDETGPSESKDPLENYMSLISLMGPVLLTLKNWEGREEPALAALSPLLKAYPCFVDGLSITQGDIATQMLDSGLLVAVFDYSEGVERGSPSMLREECSRFPRERVGLSIKVSSLSREKDSIEAIVSDFRSSASTFLFSFDGDSSPGDLLLKDLKHLILPILSNHESAGGPVKVIIVSSPAKTPYGCSDEAISSFATSHENLHIAVHSKLIPANEAETEMRNPHAESSAASERDIIGLYIRCLRSDRPDQLFTTVVCDELGVCLGLVYSNEVSVRTAICSRRGVYWSRSRGGLWRKGDTSGMHQELLSVRYDCDGDALRFTVIQHGDPPAFCHLMTRTCWGTESGLQHLEATLRERRRSAPEGSYTKRLFDDPSLLRKKLLEEVQELVEATDPDHVAAEAADVTYFMLTRCVAAGVGLREISDHLDRRAKKVTRRPGHAKDWRTRDAEAVLTTGTGAEPLADH